MDSRWIATWIYEIYRDLLVDMEIYGDLWRFRGFMDLTDLTALFLMLDV